MPPKPRFSLYGLLQAASDLLKTKISDLLLFISVAALVYSLLKGVNFDLKVIFSTLQAETLTLISIGVYVLLWLFSHGARVILWRTETRALVPASAAAANSSLLVVQAPASQAHIDILTRLSAVAFPKGAFSDRDFHKKHATYTRWFQAYPNFARLISSQKGKKPVIGFCIILPVRRSTYLAYRHGKSDPWSWDQNVIVSNKSQLQAGEPLYLFFQTLYCSSYWTPKDEAPYLTTIVIEHARSVIKDLEVEEFVMIAPRKSVAGQKGIRNLGFDGIRDSQAGFPLYELDSRLIDDRNKDAQDFKAAL